MVACKCGHGSKWAVCVNCACVKQQVPCGEDCHCAVAGVTCLNPFNAPSSSRARVPTSPPVCRCGTGQRHGDVCVDCLCVRERRPCSLNCVCQSGVTGVSCCNPFNPSRPAPAAPPCGVPQLACSPHQSQAQHWPVPLSSQELAVVSQQVTSSTDRLQQDLRHDFERLVMLMTASRDSLAFGTANQGVYGEMHRMLFSGVDKLLSAGRNPISGWQLLQCNEGSQQLQHMLGTLLHKAELRTIRLENPEAMLWRVHPEIEDAVLRDFFVQLHERVKPH